MSEATAHALPHESHEASEHTLLKFGMWLFLASEVMFFGGFFSSYMIVRLSGSENVAAWQEELKPNRPLAALNTLVLIVSSLTMALAVSAARRSIRNKTILFLGLTSLCGVIFMVVKFFEYGAKIAHNHLPSSNVLYAFYYMMTGFHGLHVVGGLIALWILMALVAKKPAEYTGEQNYGNIEIMGLYWHFVDIVWIFLFPLMYLI